ncbi:unnamed protein product [Moneuplotes crassus]|uniref:Uncharacterized protein n=1 Tax=Euplotes crassus TaxID=5936 RepID=A0AAD2DCF8_EUPCR|nr:unnamed protein product [Moneuplotes crassus]
MLRKEAANNLQKFGGNFMFDFYGGKARMDFSTRNEVEQTHQEVANTFVGEKKNKWGVLCNYITSKQNNSDIVTNVITERINDKVKSLEDVKISIKKNCKKKHKFSKMFKNNPNLNAADAMKTYDFANRSRCFSDPRIDNNVENTNFVPNNGTISPLSDNRGVTLKSPLGMKTIGPTEEKSFLKPMPKLRKKKSKKVVDGKEEDFDTYYQKMILPKPLRKVNPNLLKLLPRTTASDGHSPGLGDLETNIKPTENQKEFIRIKWELKRVETMQKTQMNQFKKLKRKLSPRKVYISEKKINPPDNIDETTLRDSLTKASCAGNKNERYSKIIHNDDRIDEQEMLSFQKQMTMPMHCFSPHNEVSKLLDDDNELKIDEIIEDMKSSEENSVSDSESYTKKQTLKPKKNVNPSKKCTGKEKRGKFFVHKAKSFMKPRKVQSINTTKNLTDKLASTKKKINMIKLSSTVFNHEVSTKRIGNSRSPSPEKHHTSDSSSENFSNDSPAGSRSPEKVDFANSIISPIRCVDEDKKDKPLEVMLSSDFISSTDENNESFKLKLIRSKNSSPCAEKTSKRSPSPKKSNKLTIKPTRITTKKNVCRAYAAQAGSHRKQKKKKSLRKMFSEEIKFRSTIDRA